jgi:hypothetical protein
MQLHSSDILEVPHLGYLKHLLKYPCTFLLAHSVLLHTKILASLAFSSFFCQNTCHS